MDDSHSSLNLKVFASHVATMAITNEFPFQLGTNPEVFKSVSGHAELKQRAGNKGAFEMLSEPERDRIKPTMTKLSLASLAFNSEHAKAIRYMAEADMIEEVIEQIIKNRQPKHEASKPRAQEVERVRRRVPEIERIVTAELCPA